MEHDFLKKYIQQHKDAFEDETLPPNMLGGIMSKLKEKQVKKTRIISFAWLAVACSLLIIVGTYLFISQEKMSKEIIAKTDIVKTIPLFEQNIDSLQKKGLSVIQYKKPIVKDYKYYAIEKPKKDHYVEIYKGLSDSSSVASRVNAIIEAGTLTALNKELKTALCQTFSADNNDNVRLAALDVLSKFQDDAYIQQYLKQGLTKQKDPAVLLELITLMNNDNSQETTDKLIELANDPTTIKAVKDQVYYALLTKK